MRGERYDHGLRGGPARGRREEYDRGWREEVAYGREPGLPGPGPFTPFGWDPMMRWGGWDPALGFVPYMDTPGRWAYGLADDGRYDHEYYRGRTAARYDRGFRGYDREQRPVPPRESPLYGRGGDRALREWARSRGYDVEHTIRPRRGGRG